VVVLLARTLRAARSLRDILEKGFGWKDEDMALFEEQRGHALEQLSKLLLKLGLVMLKGRLFVDTAVTAEWADVTAQWETLSDEPDPWERLVLASKGKFSAAKNKLEGDRAITDGVVTTLEKLKESLFKIADKDLRMG
jgi:hypothetical protein